LKKHNWRKIKRISGLGVWYQEKVVTEEDYCYNVEILDNGAICDTSLGRKINFPIYIYIYMSF